MSQKTSQWSMLAEPITKPKNPYFGSGPCAKRPGWQVEVLKNAPLGTSHRSQQCLNMIQEVLAKSKALLNLPADYQIALLGGSDTASFESAMWNLLGENPVDVVFFEEFGRHWYNDITKQLKLSNVTAINANFGEVPDISKINCDNDVVLTLNGTTSGVCFNDLDFIPSNRKGLVLCDATSAVFSIPIDFTKLDAITYSWQKSLGGEAQHGILILSPRAIDRLNNYVPTWPIPRILQLTSQGKFNQQLFNGATINTPSMMCVFDALDSLNWALEQEKTKSLFQIVAENYQIVADFAENSHWLKPLCSNKKYRSKTSACFKIIDAEFNQLDEENQRKKLKELANFLGKHHAGFDFINHKAAPPSLRIWCGPTIDTQDLIIFLQWLEYGYSSCF